MQQHESLGDEDENPQEDEELLEEEQIPGVELRWKRIEPYEIAVIYKKHCPLRDMPLMDDDPRRKVPGGGSIARPSQTTRFEREFLKALHDWFYINMEESIPMSDVAAMCEDNQELEEMRRILRSQRFRSQYRVPEDVDEIVLRVPRT